MKPVFDAHVLVPRGPEAARIAELYWFYGTVMAVVCVLVWTLVLVALFVRHAKRGEQRAPELAPSVIAETSPSSPVRTLSEAAERRRLQLVVAATGLTVLALFVLLYRSIATGSALPDQVPNAVDIELVGHRWWWSARYLDEDPSKIVTTANEIHIPVGAPVQLTLKSSDVIHSVWVPSLHGKRDLIPGRTSTLVLQADEPGIYRGQCAEFCGHAHAQMAILVIAESPQRFARWKAEQRADAHKPSTPEQVRGQDVFLKGPCLLCHTISGTPAQASTGPDLSHLASRHTLAAAMLPNNRGNLAGWVINAQHLKPGTSMPNITLQAEDLHALIAYLESLR
jgi:cytochrome c oxidase subunit 2